MSFGIFLAVMFAAVLHASWNAIIKFGHNKLQGMMVLSVSQGLMGLAIVVVYPLPRVEAWGWLLASGILHTLYKVFLTFAYQRGDLSRVYPIARGTAPMLVALIGAYFLDDEMRGTDYVGIFLVGCGILLMARGVFTNGESRALIPFALASAMATAGYSLVDGVGARISGDAWLYVAWLFVLDGVIFLTLGLLHSGHHVLSKNTKAWGLGTVAGAASFGAYAIAVWAMTVAPIALVTALRETSVLFAVVIGLVFFREKADRGKLVAAAVIACGIALTRI